MTQRRSREVTSELIRRARAAVESRHREALAALEVLEVYDAPARRHGSLSLWPLSFEDAVAGLVRVKK